MLLMNTPVFLLFPPDRIVMTTKIQRQGIPSLGTAEKGTKWKLLCSLEWNKALNNLRGEKIFAPDG
jgi:hypothetical protein